MIRRILACGVMLAAASAGAQTPDAKRVLLIGNSLTLANSLGPMIEALARAANEPPIRTQTIAFAGYSLEDHWNRGDARRAIAAGGWSAIILQQGPSSQPHSEVLLREYVRRFDRDARRSGAQIALFMVWPPRSGPGTYADVSRSYSRAADDVHGVLLRAGDAFGAALKLDPALRLFGPDGFHPSPLGSCLAATVIYQGLTRRAQPFVPRSLSAPHGEFVPITLSPATVALLSAAAGQAYQASSIPNPTR